MKTDFDESIGNINIIPQDIGRVILNLINNAFYAVDEKKKSGQPPKEGVEYDSTVSVSTKKIGDNVLIGPGTYIWTQNHKFENPIIPIRLQGSEVLPVMIEDDVWIAAGCVILPGVTIGKGSVVAAGAVVTRTAAPFSVIAGVPARRMSVRGQLAEGAARDSRTTLE